MSKRMWMAAMVAVAGASLAAAQDGASWTDSLKFKGDLRYRYENIDKQGKETRERHRVRARLQMSAEVNETVSVALRLASGSDDPVSTNQTLDGGFGTKDFRLDQAYFTWKAADGLAVKGGKMSKPWIAVSDLVWDGDLAPEGLAANYSAGEGVKLMAHAGYFLAEERSAGDDTMLYSGQLAAEMELGENAKLLVGASLYYWDRIEGEAPLFDAEDGFGNDTVDVGTADSPSLQYAGGFEEVEGFAKLSLDAGVPVTVYGQVVSNGAADSDGSGFLAGFTLGKAKAPGSFAFGYNYRELEANAVVGAFSDSDFIGGGTDGKGHKIGAAYQVASNWQLAATYFKSEIGLSGGGTDYDRLQLDLVAKF